MGFKEVAKKVIWAILIVLCCLISEGATFGLPTRLSLGSQSRGKISLNMNVQQQQDLTSDGGVKKTLLEKGTGKKLEAGDIIACEYTARAGGQIFARGERERFVYADGTLIKGWDLGVGSMKVGERAKITCTSSYAYGAKGVAPVIPADSDVEVDIKVLAWLGNQMRPESLFQKDLDIDPFIASSPETIQREYDEMQENFQDKYSGNFLEIYWKRFKNISFGFGGSGFFQSQSGERPPWYLNPNLTFPAMITLTLAAFVVVYSTGSVKEKGGGVSDLDGYETTSIQCDDKNNRNFFG